MAITLTDAAAARVTAFLENRGSGCGLRLGVKTSGCSGMAYVLEFADQAETDDTVFEDKGVKILITVPQRMHVTSPTGSTPPACRTLRRARFLLGHTRPRTRQR